MMSTDDEYDDEEPLSLGIEALEALQSILGVGLDQMSLHSLIESRRCEDEEDCEVEGDDQDTTTVHDHDMVQSGESHADYYKRLFPERYLNLNPSGQQATTMDTISHPVAVVTVEDEYVKSIILDAFRTDRPHWEVITQLPTNNNEYHFHWGEYEHIEWFHNRFHAEEILVSCYYNRKGLIRKGNLAQILEKWHAKYKGKCLPIAPKSFVLRLPLLSHTHHESNHHSNDEEEGSSSCIKEDESMSEEFLVALEKAIHESGFPGFELVDKGGGEHNGSLGESGVWILKPSVTNQAIGISLVTNMSQLRSVLYNADPIQLAGDFVLQTYLPPLLLDGRKFHLRVFMILVGNITAYVDPHFLAIFSLRQYNGAGLDDTRAHLTNIAHQDVQSIEDQHRCMRLFDETMQDMVDASLVSSIDEARARISDIRQRVYEIIAETVAAVTSELTFSSKNNCFEIFGLDFMIDKEWNTWLLEANAEPDLSKAGDRLQHVIDRMLLNTLSVVMLDNDLRFSYDNSSRKENHLVKVYDRRGRSF